MARFYQAIGEHEAACTNFILVGEAKSAAGVAPAVHEFETDWWLDHPAPWVRASGWAAPAARADVVPDAEVDTLAERALRDMDLDEPTTGGPQVHLEAIGALAALAPRLEPERAADAVQRIEPWIEREPGSHRLPDQDLLTLLAGIYRGQPTLRARVGLRLVSCLDLFAEPHRVAHTLMSCDPLLPEVEQGLIDRAAERREAADVLAYFGREGESVARAAATIARQILDAPAGASRTSWSFGLGYPVYAGYIDALSVRRRGDVARKLLELAEDRHDLAANRGQALDALAVVGQRLSDAQRRGLFPRVLALAADGDVNAMDRMHEASLHPLSRFRMDLATDALQPAALICAAALTRSPSASRLSSPTSARSERQSPARLP
jgi:hypothetical protein